MESTQHLFAYHQKNDSHDYIVKRLYSFNYFILQEPNVEYWSIRRLYTAVIWSMSSTGSPIFPFTDQEYEQYGTPSTGSTRKIKLRDS